MLEVDFGFRRLRVETTKALAARHLAERWLADIEQRLRHQERYIAAVTGGTTPAGVYGEAAALAPDREIDWRRVHLLWTDERDVPLDHPDSNYRMAMKSGLERLGIPSSQIHPMRFHLGASRESDGDAYHALCRDLLGQAAALDWIFLGMGEDGHTASLFPHSPGYVKLPTSTEAIARCPWAVAHWIADKSAWRMTLTLPLIQRSRVKVGCALGAGKAAILAEVLRESVPPFSHPASWLGFEGAPITWIADSDAAEIALR